MEKLKVAGTWVGVIEIELDSWTVTMLRTEVAKRSGCLPDSINLICAGKVLRDGDGTATQTLAKLGVKNNAKILSSRVNVDQKQELLAEEERSQRLSRVKDAVTALSHRHADGSLPVEDFNIEIEDQSGQKVNLGSETDQRAVMMGLMLHIRGKKLILKGMFKDALEVLVMGEEAFSLCNPKVIEMIDNVPILQVDMVWCYFMLRDISSISIAGIRLQKARQGLERAHGKDYSRVRLLQGGRQPEIALHLRLELLEAVVAYHSGQFDSSRDLLTSARAKFLQLQVSDEALSFVMSMGFKERDARRALRMNNQDIGSAVDFLVEEKEKRLRIDEEDRKRRSEIREQKSYGVTPLKKAVDLNSLNQLVTLGFEKVLAAEALRRNENDTQKALDDLTSPETNTMIQQEIETRKRKRQKKAETAVIEQLVSMGFERSRVVEAVQAGDTVEQAMMKLIEKNPVTDSAAASTSSPAVPNGENTSANDQTGTEEEEEEEEDMWIDKTVEERDRVMEVELAHDIDQVDAYADYDLDVTQEGEAVQEYLSLLDSFTSAGGSSSTTAQLPPQ